LRLRIVEVQPRLSVGRTYESPRAEAPFSFNVTLQADVFQVASSPSAADYRTIYLEPGDDVVIEHPEVREEEELVQEEEAGT
jgi:hypothetical protein